MTFYNEHSQVMLFGQRGMSPDTLQLPRPLQLRNVWWRVGKEWEAVWYMHSRTGDLKGMMGMREGWGWQRNRSLPRGICVIFLFLVGGFTRGKGERWTWKDWEISEIMYIMWISQRINKEIAFKNNNKYNIICLSILRSQMRNSNIKQLNSQILCSWVHH